MRKDSKSDNNGADMGDREKEIWRRKLEKKDVNIDTLVDTLVRYGIGKKERGQKKYRKGS